MGTPKKATPRVREHVDTLRQAGLDTQKFFDALVAVRDDSALPRGHREAIYKLIATESFIWYLEALRNEQIDRVKLAEEINKLSQEYEAAIRTEKKGERAAKLLDKDIGVNARPSGSQKPSMPSAATVNERKGRPSQPAPGTQGSKPRGDGPPAKKRRLKKKPK